MSASLTLCRSDPTLAPARFFLVLPDRCSPHFKGGQGSTAARSPPRARQASASPSSRAFGSIAALSSALPAALCFSAQWVASLKRAEADKYPISGYTEYATPDSIHMKVYDATISYKANGTELDGRKLDDPAKAYEYMKDIMTMHPMTETFWVIYLTTRRHPIARHLCTTGTATASLAHPREVFRGAILAGAVAVIIAHNHPSGDPEPSSADVGITRQLREAGRVLGIEVADHIIIGDPTTDPLGRGYFSFRLAGLM